MLVLPKGYWIPGPLENPRERFIYCLTFQSHFCFRSIWVVSAEHCEVLVSSKPPKTDLILFFFQKQDTMFIPTFLMEQGPLPIISPSTASIQREDVLEYPLFLDEHRAFPICYLSRDTSPSLVSTCSQPPFVIWK